MLLFFVVECFFFVVSVVVSVVIVIIVIIISLVEKPSIKSLVKEEKREKTKKGIPGEILYSAFTFFL